MAYQFVIMWIMLFQILIDYQNVFFTNKSGQIACEFKIIGKLNYER